MKKAILLLVLTLCNCLFLSAQTITGNWTGNIDVSGIQLPIDFHFDKNADGKIEGKWDSPKQNAIGLPFSSIDVNADSVHLDIKMIGGAYEGKFIGEDSITGTWTQQGNRLPLNFSRTNSDGQTQVVALLNPREKEIEISSAVGSKLYGTLLSKNNQQPLAIIVAGSGPTDRNGNSTMGLATNEYQMLARSLDSQNVASFRYDKRGIAKSHYPGMKESELVFDDYVKDAENIFDYLHDTLGYKNIYFIGHSEGSLVGMLASEKKKVKGYISVAGVGRPIDVVLKEQLQRSLPDSLMNKVSAILDELKKGKEADCPPSLDLYFHKSVQPYLISWMKYSPQKEIRKLKCPILIIQGSCDMQVKISDANNLHNANKKSVLDIIPNMSHTLKNAGENCVDENKTYTDGSMDLDQKLVKDIASFISKH